MASVTEQLEDLTNRHRHDLGDLFDYLDTIALAVGGNIQFSTPDDYTKTDETDEEIVLEVQDSEGNVLEWFDGDLAVSIAETTSGDGTAAFEGSSPFTFDGGVATVNVQLSATWATNDTFTVTIDEQSILGYTISSDAVQVTLDLS